MNVPTLIAGLVLAGAAGSLVFLFGRRDPDGSAPVAAGDVGTQLVALQQAHDEGMRQLQALAARLDRLESQAARSAPPSMTDEQVVAALRSLLERGGSELSAAIVEAAAKARAPGGITAAGALAELANADSFDAQTAVWKRAHEAGILDELVAEFERRAEADPSNPAVHVELGNAYLQKMFNLGTQGPETGMLAMKADHSYDQALALDPNHWEARFSKAMSLSFWPPIFGKQAEATKHFEILVEQQESSGIKNPDYAETYVFLGNLYQQQGKGEEARAMWQKGLALFPTHQELSSKLR